MNDILRFDQLDLGDLAEPISLQVEAGSLTVVLTPQDEVNVLLTRLLLGLTRSDAGQIHLFGKLVATLADKDLAELRKRVGTVFAGGGLVSNLKVWENLLLPVQYHKKSFPAGVDSAAAMVLERVRYKGASMELPGLLSGFQRKQVVLARAMLMDPDLMVYDSLLLGLNQRERNALLKVALAFHREKPGRTSLFLTSDPALPALLPDAEIFNISKGSIQ